MRTRVLGITANRKGPVPGHSCSGRHNLPPSFFTLASDRANRWDADEIQVAGVLPFPQTQPALFKACMPPVLMRQ